MSGLSELVTSALAPATRRGLTRPRVSLPPGKRWLDLACLCVGFPVLLPLTLAIAAYIKLVSVGPLFFRQERIGYRERHFQLLKFRSMRVDADTGVHAHHTTRLFRENAPMVKLDARGDARLIPLGWLLRSSGLDELPQLINVARGEMSIVGPRPCTDYEFAILQPEQRARFTVLPGLTGLWQVSGKNRTTFQQMIALDLEYAAHASIWLDLRIMARTPRVLLGQVREILAVRLRRKRT